MIFNPVIFGAGGSSDILYIYVAQLPDKREYYTGENFDPTGMIVKGVKQDLTEVVIPNDQLSYLPPMPLTLDSELLRLLYTDHGQTYGTTLALNILIGIVVSDEIDVISIVQDIESIVLADDVVVIVEEPISINVSDVVDNILIANEIQAIAFEDSLEPRAPIVRAIVEFTPNSYTITNASGQTILQTEYTYSSASEIIDEGALKSVTVRTDDKSSIESVKFDYGKL